MSKELTSRQQAASVASPVIFAPSAARLVPDTVGPPVPGLARSTDDPHGGTEVSPAMAARLAAPQGGAGMRADVLRSMSSAFGADFSDVRIHTDATAAAMARDVSAAAFTYGNQIYFGSGNYQPSTPAGQHLLAHELTHVAQNRVGASTVSRSPTVGLADDAAEVTAERVATDVVSRLRRHRQLGVESAAAAPARVPSHANQVGTPTIRRLRIGVIPCQAFRAAQVDAHAEYTNLNTQSNLIHDVEDFGKLMQTRILAANAAHAVANPAVANPINGIPPYRSDENQRALLRQGQLMPHYVHIDHIVRFADWGINDYRNARVISALANTQNGHVLRPVKAQERLVTGEPFRHHGAQYRQGDMLTTALVNSLLVSAETNYNLTVTHGQNNPVAHPHQTTALDKTALYDLPQNNNPNIL